MNPFLVMGLPERLVLDLAVLDERVRDLAKSAHPDVGGDVASFEEIRRSGDLLKNPELRLKSALEVAGVDASERGVVPSELMDYFSPVAGILEEVGEFVSERGKAVSALGKAVLDVKVPVLKGRLEELIGKLAEIEEGEVARFVVFDQRGWSECGEEMGACHRALLFVGKWLAQLREATGKIFEALLAG